MLKLADEIQQDHARLAGILNHLVHTFNIDKIVTVLGNMSVGDAVKEKEDEWNTTR